MGRGELLPRLSTLTALCEHKTAVYLCCTIPEVTPRRTLSVILALCSPDFPHTRRYATVSTSHGEYYNTKNGRTQIFFVLFLTAQDKEQTEYAGERLDRREGQPYAGDAEQRAQREQQHGRDGQ